MKNTLIVILTITTIALGAAGVVQWRKFDEQKIQVASLHGKLEQQTQLNAELEASEKFARQQHSEALEQANRLAAQLQAHPRATKTAGTTVPDANSIPADEKSEKQKNKDKDGFGSLFSKMMDDPEMKKMVRDQQRVALDQLYNPLVKQLNLTPEETERFKDLLADNMMKGAEKATSLFAGASATNRTEALATLTEGYKNFDETVRGFLGEGRYQQYQDYQKTVGERAQLNQFRLTTGSENPLTDQQTERLLAFMKEEKQNVAAATGQPAPGSQPDAATMQAMLSGEGAEKILQAQEAANQQVLARAKDVLSPAQLDAFGKFQANQLKMARIGMTMAQKFMAPEQATKP